MKLCRKMIRYFYCSLIFFFAITKEILAATTFGDVNINETNLSQTVNPPNIQTTSSLSENRFFHRRLYRGLKKVGDNGGIGFTLPWSEFCFGTPKSTYLLSG